MSSQCKSCHRVVNYKVHKCNVSMRSVNLKQEHLVFILVILYIGEYLCVVIKLFTGTRVSKDFQFRVSGSRNNRKRTALVHWTQVLVASELGLSGSVPKKNLGSESELVPRDSMKNIRIKYNLIYSNFVDPYDAKEFQVLTANAVMIILFNLKYVSKTLWKILETCFHYHWRLQYTYPPPHPVAYQLVTVRHKGHHTHST